VQFDHDLDRITPSSASADAVTMGGNAAVNVPAGTTAQRTAAPIAGSLRFNTTTGLEEIYTGTVWLSPVTSIVAGTGITIAQTAGAVTINAAASGGSVTSVALTLPSIFTVTGSPVTTTGTLSATLNTQANNTVFAGPATGGPLAPTFRTLSLAGNDITDVLITSPAVNQVLAWNGTDFVNTGAVGANATGLVGVGQAGAAAWTLSSGKYVADFAHNLATYNVVVTVYDTGTNAVVIPDAVTLTSTNNVRIQATTNTRTLRVVVVANGQSIVTGGSTPSSVVTAVSGVTVNATATKLNFTGQAVNVTDAGGNTSNISIGSRFTYFANSLDSVNNADFAVNGLSPVTTDPTYNSLNVRSFLNTAEQGVGFTSSIPSGATQVTLKLRGRAATAPGVASVVMFKLYSRLLPNNSAVGTWSTGTNLSNNAIPTNAFFQYYTQTIALSTLGLTAGNLYQFELTRPTTGFTGTNLAAAFLLAEITLEFA
jgi:hypothetical protein